jgi:hypothetical protein
MKNLFLLSLLVLLAIAGCSKDDDDDVIKGLVQFSQEPTYENEQITFQAEILYSVEGQPAEIQFQILEGDVVLNNETIKAETNIDGIGFSYRTPEIVVSTPLEDFGGKDLTFFLDPEHKLTQDQYTTEQAINLYKRKTVSIPAQ